MKITILGAAGVRTPLIVEALVRRQTQLGLTDLALMDIDAERLALIGALTAPLERADPGFRVVRTTDARVALAGADFVITTFRVGGMEARVVDERVPLRLGVLGQETTGPGGFALGLRSIPVLLDYLKLMRELCPTAWLINFANPSGMLAEAAVRYGHWERTVGICDAPSMMHRAVAALLGVPPETVLLDYVGLNHLGWGKAVLYQGHDCLPELLERFHVVGGLPGFPFTPEFVALLGLIPNEYLFYYYATAQAVQNILAAPQTRGEAILAWNTQLFAELRRLQAAGDAGGMIQAYQAYLAGRGATYMAGETGANGHGALPPGLEAAIAGEGYAGVALDLIEALLGHRPGPLILNVPNRGAVSGLPGDAVLEVSAYVGPGFVRPLAVGAVPAHCLGLMQQVKAYERLTIKAAVSGSYTTALRALTLHPLVPDFVTAQAILDGYRAAHGALFPDLR